MTEVLAPYVTARDSWTDYVPGRPDEVQAEAAEEVVKAENTEVPVWDLRPVGEMGNSHGAEGRQWARLNYLESVGALVQGNHLEGSGIIVVFKQGKSVEEIVVACQPIPLSEMIPNANPAPEGVVTPLKPAGKPEFLFEK